LPICGNTTFVSLFSSFFSNNCWCSNFHNFLTVSEEKNRRQQGEKKVAKVVAKRLPQLLPHFGFFFFSSQKIVRNYVPTIC